MNQQNHEREPEMDIKSTNMVKSTNMAQTTHDEEIEIHTNHCEDHAERLRDLERRGLSRSQACNKISPKQIFYGKQEWYTRSQRNHKDISQKKY